MCVNKKLAERRRALGLTMEEVAAAVGVSKGTISRWESGEIDNMRRDRIAALAKVLRVSPLFVMGMPEESKARKGIRIPVLGRVAAGIPIEAVEEVLDYEEIDEATARRGDFFGLRIQGQSMEPTLYDGDTIIVRKQEVVENGEIAVVLINGCDATVKEVKRSPDGLTLIGHNAAVYTPHYYSKQEVASLPIRIIGKVEELRRKF
ncbi:MAG: helix-turn-helix domain-containing protein [Selenomonas sp.]|nr:helix-turn-helix domain-containing protein [Selenomonas sp.]